MPYLFQASIGPVQAFIASARRTRDLWFGSWLLSELAKAAALRINADGGTLIFPAADSSDLEPDSALNVANKIVALITNEPAQVGNDVQAALTARLNDIWKEAQKTIYGKLDDDKRAEAQLADLVEYQWVALPFDEAQYATTRAALDALLAARKTTRDFAAVTWGGPVPKSSITGQLESVISEAAYPARRDDKVERKRKIDNLFNQYGAGQAERLSAVDLLKRHGRRSQQTQFLSTSHVAALPFLCRFDGVYAEPIETTWLQYLAALPEM